MKKRFNKRLAASILAPISAILVFLCVFLGPLALVFLSLGIPFDEKGPDWGVWVIIVSGGPAVGATLFIHHLILEKLGGFSTREINEKWYGKR